MTFGLASFISIFFPAISGAIFLNRTNKLFKYFSYFIFLICGLECIANYLFYTHQSNLMIYTFSLLLETIALTLILNRSIKNSFLEKVIVLALLVYIISFFYFIFYGHIITEIDSEYRMITCVLLIFLGGITFIQQSKNMEVHIFTNPMFILSFAVLLYYGSTLFVHGALHIILAKSFSLVAKQIWNAHSVINIITNILFAYAIWLSYRQKKLSL
jgi:hypothetical protein